MEKQRRKNSTRPRTPWVWPASVSGTRASIAAGERDRLMHQQDAGRVRGTWASSPAASAARCRGACEVQRDRVELLAIDLDRRNLVAQDAPIRVLSKRSAATPVAPGFAVVVAEDGEHAVPRPQPRELGQPVIQVSVAR